MITILNGRNRRRMFAQSGFTLVEYLITTAVSLLFIGLMITAFLTIKQSYVFAQTRLELNYQAILIHHWLQELLQEVGWIGCGYFKQWPEIIYNAERHSIKLITGDHISSVTAGDAFTLNIKTSKELHAHERFLITDCQQIEYLNIQKIHKLANSWQLELRSPVTLNLDNHLQLIRLVPHHIFLQSNANSTDYRLLWQMGYQSPEEMASHVEKMQVSKNKRVISFDWIFSNHLINPMENSPSEKWLRKLLHLEFKLYDRKH